jgi:hypothetical protein
MPVELAAAGHRPLAPDVEGSERIELPGIGQPSDHTYCCCTKGSEAVGSIRPNSSGGPLYLSRSDRMLTQLCRCCEPGAMAADHLCRVQAYWYEPTATPKVQADFT